MNKFPLIALAALLVMGCVAQTEVCVDGNCSNASVNVSVELPEANISIPTIPPVSFEPAVLFEFVPEDSSVKLGEEVAFTVDFDLGEGNYSYADLFVYAGEAPVGNYSVAKGEPAHLSYSLPALQVGEAEYSAAAVVYYANGSEYDSLERSFTVQVDPISYYRNEQSNHSVNASSKAAQSFTLAHETEVSRVSFYGLKRAEEAIQFELCEDEGGAPGKPLYYNNYDVTGVPELPAWYSVDLNASLEPGTYWILLTTQGEFEWYADLYGENAESESLYRYGGSWAEGGTDKFYRVTNA